MKGKEKIKLTKSQKIALQMKSEKVQHLINLAKARQKEVQALFNMIITEEHNIPKNEVGLWKLSKDGQAIEKKEHNKRNRPDN